MSEPLAFKGLQCIHERFDDIAMAFPERPAVSDKIRSLNYRELFLFSNRVAHLILGTLGQGKGNIGLLIENNVSQVAAILGILKSGRSYVALDADFPAERNRKIIEDAACKMLMCTRDTEPAAREIAGKISTHAIDRDYPGLPASVPQTQVLPSDNAVTLYTSGSTGEPKGVLQSHGNMVHFIQRMSNLYPIQPDDKVAYFLSVAFSAHALPLLGSLLNGSELKTFRLKTENFHGYSKWFRESGISYAMMIPSFLRHFIAARDIKDKFPDLRTLLLGGETLYRSDVMKARQVFGKKTLMVNIYASTEAYLMRSFPMTHETIIKTNIVPIGYPVEGMDLEIIDEKGKKVQGQQRGEILLKSKYVTEGYWKRPSLTEKDFSTDPEDGQARLFNTSDTGYYLEEACMVHTGRKDSVVKLRGYRIEFGEIINVLLQNDDIVEAACAIRKDPQENEHLVAYYVPVGDRIPDEEYLHASMVRLLPDYMLPSHMVKVKEIPKNKSGKADMTSLPDPVWHTDIGGIKKLPGDETEKSLVEIFEKTLKISPIGVEDNFLKLGGNSLLLFVAFSEVEKKFNLKIDLKTATDSPNISSLARIIRQENKA